MKTSRYVSASYIWPRTFDSWQLPIGLANEIRAVFPAFFLALVFQCFGFLHEAFALFAFSVACAGLPSLACGHDFMHRTLALTLSMPIERGALWRLRLKIAFFCLLPLAALTMLELGWNRTIFTGTGVHWMAPLLVVEIGMGLCLAPWITLRMRSPLAGTVFTLATPFCFYYFSKIAAYLRFGSYYGEMPESIPYQSAVSFAFFILVCAWGAFAGYRGFLRLEAIEPRRFSPSMANLSTPSAAGKIPSPRKHSALGRLVVKELRLQSMCFVPAAALAVTCWMFKEGRDLDTAQALLWGWLACVVLGAAGSAEERQLGLAEWQALLPLSRTRQWMVKVGVLVALGVVMAVVMPMAMLNMGPAHVAVPGAMVLLWWSVSVIGTVILSLYISSLCETTLKATLAGLATPIFVPIIILSVSFEGQFTSRNLEAMLPWPEMAVFSALLFFALFAVIARYAKLNHFSAERSGGRIAGQVIAITGALAIAALMFFVNALIQTQ